ncbi:DUF6879 family protein [Streptomyces sp. NPDC006997]|uniref:DUF6879 family protein n=1 Tax=Streptomyces sp. NPDC006997 TaxID=3155356 RepID=UPI0033F5C5AE
MARRLRFNGTGSGVNGCPSLHEDLDTGDVIVHGPALTEADDVAQLKHLNEGEVPIVVPRELLVDFAPAEVTRVPHIIGLDDFDRLFTQFEHTAWRLESRRRYASDEHTDPYAPFTRGEPVNWAGIDAEWCAERREQTGLGKRFERVRIVDNPPTAGQLYLLDNARRNSAVGENWHAELWIDDEAGVDTYLRTWKTLRESAVYGADAHHLISAARRTLRSR